MTDVKVIEIDREVADNYRRLKDERELTWEQLAAQMQVADRRLSAWFRQQADLEAAPPAKNKTPKDRRPTGPINTTSS